MASGYNYDADSINKANEHAYLSGLVAQAQATGDSGLAAWAHEQANIYGMDLSKPFSQVQTAQGTNTVGNTGPGATTVSATTTTPNTTVVDEAGNPTDILPISGFNTAGLTQVGFIDDAKNLGGNLWDGIQAIGDTFKNIATGINLTSSKFFSLLLWWLPIFFVLTAAIKFGKFKVGGKYVSLGR